MAALMFYTTNFFFYPPIVLTLSLIAYCCLSLAAGKKPNEKVCLMRTRVGGLRKHCIGKSNRRWSRIPLFLYQIFPCTSSEDSRGKQSDLWCLHRSCSIKTVEKSPRMHKKPSLSSWYYLPSLLDVSGNGWQLRFEKDLGVKSNPRSSYEYSEADLWNLADSSLKVVLNIFWGSPWLSWMKIPSAPADVRSRKLQWSRVPACVYLLAPCRRTRVASFHSLIGAVSNSSEEGRIFFLFAVFFFIK